MGLGQREGRDFSQRLRLLVVGEDAQQATRLLELLGSSAEATDLAGRDSVPRMRRALHEHSFDCVLLALAVAGTDATAETDARQTIEAVLSSVEYVPVVVFADDPSLALHAIHQGAQEYLVASAVDGDAVRRAIRHSIARKRTEGGLARQALHDALTGLPNRALMLDRLNVAVARSRRRPTSVALLFLDLDGFKRVNDSFGHEAGDELLVEVARRLQRVLRPGDTVARYGGDEFVILCEGLRGQREAWRVAERARATIGEPFQSRGQEIFVQASVGVARALRPDIDAHDLIREADVAMYRAKRRGGGIELFEAMHELEIEAPLREAIRRAGLSLHYQPVLSLAGATLRAVEALVRWERPDGPLHAPGEFLPLAEEIGLIAQIDQWVLSEACCQLARWRSDGLVDATVSVAVNLSSHSLRSPELADAIARATAAAGIPFDCLSLELTEASLEPGPRNAADMLAAVAGLGVRLCLDDFGTARSTFGALSGHPFGDVKFGAATNPRMLAAVLGAAHAAGVTAIGKGIETESQLAAVRQHGCGAGQGFLFARPAPAAEVGRWLAVRR